MPASDVRDNEFVPGHLTGYNFLALSGLKLAIEMANETGHAELAKSWQAEYDDYHAAFLKVLDKRSPVKITATFHRRSMGRRAATTGATCSQSFPSRRSTLTTPRVTATLKATQAKYAEGIMTYANGEFFHHYLTIKNTMTEVIRGDAEDQAQADRELYALLVHTSSTHAGFEFAMGFRGATATLKTTWLRTDGLPPSTGPFCAPCWFAKKGNQLHLLSAISPAWIGAGKSIAVRQAPSNFGGVAFTLDQPWPGEAVLHLNMAFTRPPQKIVIHIPWFVDSKSATADGKAMQAVDGALAVSPETKNVQIRWTLKSNAPSLSYDSAVRDYKAEYARRYQILMHGEAAR